MLGTRCIATDDKIGVSPNIGIILTFTVINTFIQLLPYYHGFPCGSDNKEYACNAGDPGSIPRTGRSLEKRMATHSSILVQEIPWTEEPGRLQLMGSQRVGHD